MIFIFGNRFIAGSSKRKAGFTECKAFLKAEKKAILYRNKTRWLVMESVSVRMIDQWDPLTLYFQSYLTGENEQALRICHSFMDPIAKLFFLFLTYILSVVNLMNAEFQIEKVRFHEF